MNKQIILGAVCLALTGFAFVASAAEAAQDAKDTKPKVKRSSKEIAEEYAKLSPEQKAERRRKFMEAKRRHMGGFVDQPDSMKGSIVFFNAQSTFKPEAIDPAIEELKNTLRFDIRREKLDFTPTRKEAAKILKDKGVTFGIFLVDDKDDSVTLSIFPEQKYAFINAVAVGGKDLRFQRELKRTFAYLCGSASSTYPASLLSPVLAPIDLDTFENDRYSVDIVQRISLYMKGYEVTPLRTTTYRQAVEEGWAPQPTNDYQKAIWSEIRSIPAKPIKIEP